MPPSPQLPREVKWIGGATVLAVGGVLLLATAAGALFAARAAARRVRATSESSDEPEAPAPQTRQGMARATGLLRQGVYWALLAVAASASWLARVARPSER